MNRFLLNKWGGLLVLLLLSMAPAFAVFSHGKSEGGEAEWVRVQGHILLLNGRGVHALLFFRVYQVSLYLESPSHDRSKILDSKDRKLLRLKFLRDIPAEKLRTSFAEGIGENCGGLCPQMGGYLDYVNGKITDFHEGDYLDFQFVPGGLALMSNTGISVWIPDENFSRIFFSLWLGPRPPSERLQRQILGLDESVAD